MYRGAGGPAPEPDEEHTRTADVRGNVPQTQQERKAETRARLLAAAAGLFADQGVDAVSIDAVAEAAGRTSGAVYAHFGSKQGLLLALLDSWKDSVLTVLLAEVAVTASPLGQLAAVWENVAPTPAEAGSWSLLEQELWLRAARDPEVADVLRVRNAEALRYSARQLEGWTDRRRLPTVGTAPSDLAVLVKALLAGLAVQRRLEPGVGERRSRRAGPRRAWSACDLDGREPTARLPSRPVEPASRSRPPPRHPTEGAS